MLKFVVNHSLGRGLPGHCEVLSSISSLHPLGTSTASFPRLDRQSKMSLAMARGTLRI